MEVVEAADWFEALAQIQARAPDLILLDVMMPGLTGWELAAALADDPATAAIPIVFLSARAEARDEARGLALGALDYVTKPFDPVELVRRVERALAASRDGASPPLRPQRLSEPPMPPAAARPEPPEGAPAYPGGASAPPAGASRVRLEVPLASTERPPPPLSSAAPSTPSWSSAADGESWQPSLNLIAASNMPTTSCARAAAARGRVLRLTSGAAAGRDRSPGSIAERGAVTSRRASVPAFRPQAEGGWQKTAPGEPRRMHASDGEAESLASPCRRP